MKTTHFTQLCLLIALAVSLVTCLPNENIQPETKGSLLLGVEFSENDLPEGRISASDNLSVVISIKDEKGNLVLDQEVLKLFKVNKEYLTKPISLNSGNYQIVDFFVVDDKNEAIYMTPKEGSLLAYLIEKPVPISFTIETDKSIKLMPEVITTMRKIPAEFGYASFNFDFIETFDFLISIFSYEFEDEAYELTEANLVVKADGEIVFDSTLLAVTNQITLPSNYTNYELIVSKPLFKTNSSTYSMDELILHFSENDLGPLQIILENGLILWNKLGSESEVTNSEFGPHLAFGDNIHEFVAGMFGNAVTIKPGNYSNMQRHRNILFTNLPDYLETESGTIECYFKANAIPVAYSHNPYRIFNG